MSDQAAERPGLRLDDATLAAVAEICRRFGVARLDLFGSAARADFDPARSDVDLVMSYRSEQPRSLRDWFGLQRELEHAFGRAVDLVSDAAVTNPYMRREIERGRRPLFPPP